MADTSYTIKNGDTLGAIAKNYGTDVGTLAKLNNISNVNLIRSGSTLTLPGGATVPASTPTQIPSSITTDAIKPAPTVTVPTTPPAPAGTPVPTNTPTPPANTNAAADALIAATTVADTATQTQGKGLSQKIVDLTSNLTGQTQALSDAEVAAGVPGLKSQLNDINGQILAKQAEIGQDDTTLVANSRAEENRDTLLPFAQSSQAKLAGDAAITRALKTSEIGVLNARVQALNGSIQLAEDTAQKAVDAKYAPYKEQIAVYQAQLDALKPLLDADQTKQAAEQQTRVNLALKDIDTKADNEKSIQSVMIEAAKNRAPQDVLNAISSATTVKDAITAAGSSLATPNTEVIKLGDNAVLIDKTTGKIVKNYGSGVAGGASAPTNATDSTKALTAVSGLIGGFSSVAAQKAFTAGINNLAQKPGNEQAIAEKIVGQAISNIADPDTRKRVNGGFAIAQQVTRLQSLLDDYTAAGGQTGLLTGTKQSITQRLGKVGDPKLANIGTQILNTVDQLARARTGAVLSPSEQRLYDSMLPGIDKVGDLNTAISSGLKDSLMSDVENNLRFTITSDGLSVVKSALPDIFDNSSAVGSYVDNALGGGSMTMSADDTNTAINSYLGNLFTK